MLLVDSHCHLNFPDFREDLDAVIDRARQAGVGVIQTICTEMNEFEEVAGIAERYEGVYCSVGVHPNDSGKQEVASVDELVTKSHNLKTIGLGETGLDYHYEHSDRSRQRESFLNHIHAARITGLPLIVHTRQADADTIDILTSEYQNGGFTGVIHCFTSTELLARKTMDIGFYISFSGIVSFKNAKEIQEVAKLVPLDRLLIETDAPFLAPVPHRGKRNEPSFVTHTNAMMANLKNISQEECATSTTENFFKLFSKAVCPEHSA